MENLLQLDREVLIFLNNLGSEPFDALWLIITKQIYWLPFFLFLAYIIHKKTGVKNLGLVLVFIAIILFLCNTSVEFCKNTFLRLRPNNDPIVMHLIRVVHHSKTYSFFSGHAANSLATMTFLYHILKNYYKKAYLIFLYPLIFAYSRIYLGVHFPSDILTGYFFGFLFGLLAFRTYCYILILTAFCLNSKNI